MHFQQISNNQPIESLNFYAMKFSYINYDNIVLKDGYEKKIKCNETKWNADDNDANYKKNILHHVIDPHPNLHLMEY